MTVYSDQKDIEQVEKLILDNIEIGEKTNAVPLIHEIIK